jgi:hypothetical protein
MFRFDGPQVRRLRTAVQAAYEGDLPGRRFGQFVFERFDIQLSARPRTARRTATRISYGGRPLAGHYRASSGKQLYHPGRRCNGPAEGIGKGASSSGRATVHQPQPSARNYGRTPGFLRSGARRSGGGGRTLRQELVAASDPCLLQGDATAKGPVHLARFGAAAARQRSSHRVGGFDEAIVGSPIAEPSVSGHQVWAIRRPPRHRGLSSLGDVLHSQPSVGRAPTCLFQPDRHFGRHAAMFSR